YSPAGDQIAPSHFLTRAQAALLVRNLAQRVGAGRADTIAPVAELATKAPRGGWPEAPSARARAVRSGRSRRFDTLLRLLLEVTPVLDHVPVACNRCHLNRSPEPARSRIATCADQNRTANSVLYLHMLARGNQIANPAQALETTYVRISERGRENE